MKICFERKYGFLRYRVNAKSCFPQSKNSRSSFAVRRISLKNLINTGLDSYSSHSKDKVGEAYAFMIFHPFSTKKLDISVIPFRMQSINQIHFNVQQKSKPVSFCQKKDPLFVSDKSTIKIEGQ